MHVHERIDPRSIIEEVKRRNGNGQPKQLGLFETERAEPLRQAVEFYKHAHGWSNRMVAGDSLLVMNSLLEKEGMAGKVQMVYLAPPYGIKYGSNFQPFVGKRDVKDGKDEDLTAEPEQIRALRDTWELGIHSYLTYLRDRLLLARELLAESGSVFVQISDENVHHVRELMDEVFGARNFVAVIAFKTATNQNAKRIQRLYDFLVWYRKQPGCRHLHADGETRPNDAGADQVREGGAALEAQRIVVAFGPEHAPLEQRQVAQAIEEAQTLVPRPKRIVFAAFQFDPEAAKDIDETNWPGVTLLKAEMNPDLLTDDLKKKRASNESFWLIGQPDVRVECIAKGEDKGKLRVSVHGFDYYNTKTGGVESGGEDRIAVWLLDTDYDGRSLYPRQVFFPMAGDKEGWARLAMNLRAEIDEDLIETYRGTVSLPFAPGGHQRVAVKIVDDRGIESLRVMEVEE